MSTAAAAPTKTKRPMEFDDGLLQEMAEPIAITIDRIISGRTMPWTQNLPIKPGQSTAGMGWTKDDVKNLNEHLVTHAEAGLYQCAATDETGRKMKWQAYLPVTSRSAAENPVPSAAPAGPATTTPVQPTTLPPGVIPNPYAFGGPAMAQPSWLQTVPHTYPNYGQAGVPGGYMNVMPGMPQPMQQYGAPPPGLRLVPTEEDKLRMEREERLKLEAKIERERLEASHREQINSVRNEMRQLTDGIRTQGSETGEVVKLKQQLDEARRVGEQNQLMALIERQRQDTAAMIAAMQQQSREQMAAIQLQMQQVVAAANAKPSGPDPAILMMIESMKTQAQTQMQMFQVQMDAQRHASEVAMRMQMGPKELIEMYRSSNQTGDQLASAYGKVHELMMTSVETILAQQGPTMHPALQMLGEGIQGAIGIGQRAVEAREQEAHLKANTAAQQSQAQLALAQQLARANSIAQQQQQAPAQIEAAEGDDEEGDDDGEDEAPDEGAPSDNVVVTGVVSAEVRAERRKHEREQFGDAYDAIVNRLRRGVRNGSLDAQKAAMAITQGVMQYADQVQAGKNPNVPVFELWRQQRLDELVEKLLPEAKPSYRGEIVAYIVQLFQHEQARVAQATATAAGNPTAKRVRGAKAQPAPAAG